jgi:hypothetical protein
MTILPCSAPADLRENPPGQPKTVHFPAFSIYVNAAFCAPLPFTPGEAG